MTTNITANIKLPQLTGTKKQIAWAEKLRKKFLVFAFQEYNLANGGLSEEQKQIIESQVPRATSAKFWIEKTRFVTLEYSTEVVTLLGDLAIFGLRDLDLLDY